MSEIDWSKAPEWADKYGVAGPQDLRFWYSDKQYAYISDPKEIFIFGNLDTFSRDIKDFTLIDQRPSQAWSGDGRPPVGELIEALWSASGDVWLKTIVFAFNEHGQPIHRWEEGPKKYEYQASPLVGMGSNKPYFRPIRTPEQIEADEREQRALDLFRIAWPETHRWSDLSPHWHEAFYRLADSAYRKQ